MKYMKLYEEFDYTSIELDIIEKYKDTIDFYCRKKEIFHWMFENKCTIGDYYTSSFIVGLLYLPIGKVAGENLTKQRFADYAKLVVVKGYDSRDDHSYYDYKILEILKKFYEENKDIDFPKYNKEDMSDLLIEFEDEGLTYELRTIKYINGHYIYYYGFNSYINKIMNDLRDTYLYRDIEMSDISTMTIQFKIV